MKVHGSLGYKKGKWIIDAEPHVVVRLKRVFPRVARRQHGKIRITDTIETSRDLEWFMQRFPLAFESAAVEQRLTARAAEQRQREHAVAELLSGVRPAAEFDLAVPAREYQRLAADLALTTGGLLVADDVGLGKTCTAICMLTDPRTRPALIVTLTHLPKQWQAEIEKFAPGLRTHVVKSGKPYDLRANKGTKPGQLMLTPEFPDVIIMNYHKLSGWSDVLAPIVKSVVFDEIQELRRGDASDKGAAAYHIAEQVPFRIGLSATPIYNYGGEIWNVLEAVRPGALGSYEEFLQEWCGHRYGERHAKIKDPRAFGTYLRDGGLMLRRTREEVGRELPELTRVPHHVDCDSRRLEDIDSAAAELARVILSQNPLARGERFRAAEELSHLVRQATGIAKAPFVADFVRLLVEGGEKVVLYGWHREVYGLWLERLADLQPAMFTGSESPAQKDEARRRFVAGETPVLIMSLRAGAGLDGLQKHGRTVVFGELDWSPGVHDQCLSADTEVLTREGFRGVDDVGVGTTIAAFDPSDGSVHWLPALKKTDRVLAPGERIYATRTEKTDVRVTGEHRMLVRRKTRTTEGVGRSSWDFALAEDVAGESRRFIPTCGIQRTSGVALNDFELRFLGWFITDGHFNGRFVTIFQADQQPWNEDLVEVLDGCGFTWRRYQRRVSSGTLMNYYVIPKGTFTRWSAAEITKLQTLLADGASYATASAVLGRSSSAVGKKARKLMKGPRREPVQERRGRGWEALGPYLDKQLAPELEAVDQRQLLLLIRGLHMGDGDKSPRLKNVWRITNTDKKLLDRVQSLCVRRGLSASISERKHRTSAGRKAYDIFISRNTEALLPRHGKANAFSAVEMVAGERVWCLTNSLGTLVTRRNGRVAVVGNCIGRVHRDGQGEPVIAYFLVADSGCDPIIADVLGLKRAQIEGIVDPGGALVQRLDVSGQHIKLLAEAYLAKQQRADEVSGVHRIEDLSKASGD